MLNCNITAICNQKGGVTKTTTTANLGIGLALQGEKVLLVDADPQADKVDGVLLTLADTRTNLARAAAEISAAGQSIFAYTGYLAKSQSLWGEERPRSAEPFGASGERDKQSAPRRGSKMAQVYSKFTKEVIVSSSRILYPR